MPENITVSHKELLGIEKTLAVLSRDMQIVVETVRRDGVSFRGQMQSLTDRVLGIEIARAEERALQKGRAQMARWVWCAAVGASGTIGSMITIAVTAYLKLHSI